MLSKEPASMQLRYFAALHDIASEKTNTIVFPLPMEMLKAFSVGKGEG